MWRHTELGQHSNPAKQERWGSGFHNRRELVRKALMKPGLGQERLNHGIQREVFVVPLASNTRAFLRGEEGAGAGELRLVEALARL